VLTALRDEEGQLVGYVKILRDHTERKAYEEEREGLIKSLDEANTEKEHFLAVLAHDLRGPVTGLIGWSALGRSGKLKSEQAILRAFEIIDRSAREKLDLMEKMLELARITSGKLQLIISQFDLISVVTKAIETVRPTAELKKISIQQLTNPSQTIIGDTDRIQQVLLKLLWNAVKFTPEKGVVQVECVSTGSCVRLSVSDNGPGIAPDVLPHIFEPFRRSVESGQAGAGLGLAIVRHIVELHHGRIEAENLSNVQGSRFTIVLPNVTESVHYQMTA
jgi:signal transduction histidine kinase